MALIIRKKGNKNFWHYDDSFVNPYSASDLTIIFDGNLVKLRSESGRIIFKREGYNFTDVTIYDDTVGGGAETFGSVILLEQRLIDLRYPAFCYEGETPIVTGFIPLPGTEDGSPVTGDVVIVNGVKLRNSTGSSIEFGDGYVGINGDIIFNGELKNDGEGTFVSELQMYNITENRYWGMPDVNGEVTVISTGSSPSSSSDTGMKGDIRYDASFKYECIDTDTWIRIPITTTF